MTTDTASLIETLERLEKAPIEPWTATWYEDVAHLRKHLPSILSALKERERLRDAATKILAKLDHPTASVTQWDADDLRAALQPQGDAKP